MKVETQCFSYQQCYTVGKGEDYSEKFRRREYLREEQFLFLERIL